jgi:hypothetical protein
LIIGIVGPVADGVDGSGRIITLHFKAKIGGTGRIAFENENLCDTVSTDSCARNAALSWYGGNYTIEWSDVMRPLRAAP